MENRKVIKYLGYVVILVIVFVSGLIVGRVVDPFRSGSFNLPKIISNNEDIPKEINFDLFWNVWNTMSSQYVDTSKIDYEKMFYGAIKGVVSSYDDPATVFLDPKETEEFNKSNQGKVFEGIGAELGYSDGQIIVVTPIDGSPAQKAGIKAGDVILKVDGVDIKQTDSIYDVVGMVRGKAGTTVKLTVLHNGENQVSEISVVRGEIDLPSIELKDVKDNPDIKVIDVGRFTDSSVNEWKKNWDKVVDQALKSNPKGIILDLRSNPGGYFDSAVYAGGEFLPRNTIIAKHEDRKGNGKDYRVNRMGKMLDMPVVVLVNGYSASASEILSGALKYHNRAIIIGEPTYGKGTAQSIISLSRGTSLHITTLKWLLPDGSWINKDNTINPNIEVKYSEEDFKKGVDNQLNRAVEELRKIIK